MDWWNFPSVNAVTEAPPKDPETSAAEPNGKKDWLQWRCWTVLRGLTSALTLIIAAAGLYFVFRELQQARELRAEDLQHRKADITLGFVERFNSDVYVMARNEILRPWLRYQAQLGLANEHDGLSKEQIRRLTDLILQQERAAGGLLDTYILTMVTFFDELAICLDGEICDCETTRQYFQSRAKDLDTLYGPALESLETAFDLNDAGRGLKDIAELETCARSG